MTERYGRRQPTGGVPASAAPHSAAGNIISLVVARPVASRRSRVDRCYGRGRLSVPKSSTTGRGPPPIRRAPGHRVVESRGRRYGCGHEHRRQKGGAGTLPLRPSTASGSVRDEGRTKGAGGKMTETREPSEFEAPQGTSASRRWARTETTAWARFRRVHDSKSTGKGSRVKQARKRAADPG